ncbi:HpcH/HpaI aldolase/citrate lyase family protein [Noviherbaspirillum sedimenti]|uniref:CoA ester lyase n=1 Tax=Noviherbaspirillum sedimenti TaxID=2320865 RepID=A0A3A3GPA5_9BURK|nr:CoA ester lyase [Noviherbaspirillum sedimenti]RJG02820.1 CoA ester lyase [Noviherbaspirillum sedimenti]
MSQSKQQARSYLFVPANRPDRFDKAEASGADALILDLEDSVPAAEKQFARDAVVQWQQKASQRPLEIWIRINPLANAGISADLDAVMQARPTGVVLPKCEGVADVETLNQLLGKYEQIHGLPDQGIAVMAIATETPRALQRLHTFDQPMPRLRGMLWGAEDLAAALGLRSLRDQAGNYLSPALGARDRLLVACHACHVAAIDAVYTGLNDPAGLANEIRLHAAIGFTAKAAIHPNQIEVIHQGLQPSADDVAWAKEVIDALRDGEIAAGKVRGAMVDQPHLNAARRILSIAQRSQPPPSAL